MFTKVQIYCKGGCGYGCITNSLKPYIIINIDKISTLGPRDTHQYDDSERYPFRLLNMNNGENFLVVLESANKLEKMLLHGIKTTAVPLVHVKEEAYWPAGNVPVDEEKLRDERREIR